MHRVKKGRYNEPCENNPINNFLCEEVPEDVFHKICTIVHYTGVPPGVDAKTMIKNGLRLSKQAEKWITTMHEHTVVVPPGSNVVNSARWDLKHLLEHWRTRTHDGQRGGHCLQKKIMAVIGRAPEVQFIFMIRTVSSVLCRRVQSWKTKDGISFPEFVGQLRADIPLPDIVPAFSRPCTELSRRPSRAMHMLLCHNDKPFLHEMFKEVIEIITPEEIWKSLRSREVCMDTKPDKVKQLEKLIGDTHDGLGAAVLVMIGMNMHNSKKAFFDAVDPATVSFVTLTDYLGTKRVVGFAVCFRLPVLRRASDQGFVGYLGSAVEPADFNEVRSRNTIRKEDGTPWGGMRTEFLVFPTYTPRTCQECGVSLHGVSHYDVESGGAQEERCLKCGYRRGMIYDTTPEETRKQREFACLIEEAIQTLNGRQSMKFDSVPIDIDALINEHGEIHYCDFKDGVSAITFRGEIQVRQW